MPPTQIISIFSKECCIGKTPVAESTQSHRSLCSQRHNANQTAGREEAVNVWIQHSAEGILHAGGSGAHEASPAACLPLHGESQAIPT